MRYAYPCDLEPEEDESSPGFTVTFPDVPGALTCGSDLGEALESAEEALELMLGDYIETGREIPAPSTLEDGQELVAVRPAFAAKLALYSAMRQQGISAPRLDRAAGCRRCSR